MPAQEAEYDSIVIGGGPAGSTAATLLARAGRKVLLLEREHFPRFHIGESLLPYNQPIFEELGVLPKLEAAGLIKKFGAQFHLGNAAKSIYLVFRRGRFTRSPEAFQVERSTFDKLLLDHSKESGVDVREGWTVTNYTTETDGVKVRARAEGSAEQMFSGRFLIDASGRANLTGNQEGIREIHPRHKKVAIFGHFNGVRVDKGEPGGDTVILRLENKWFWLIPLTAEKVSVGCVLDQEELGQSEQRPEELFETIWRSSPAAYERMKEATLLGKIHVTSDFSYFNRRYTGHRLIRIGDAAAFMDPIFSSGVYLACYTGKLAAEAIGVGLKNGTDGARQLRAYERKLTRAMRIFWEMVEAFYTTPFMEIFMNPKNRFSLPAAITAVLAGELDGGFRIWWRMRLFYALVKMQKRWPLVPRINFSRRPAGMQTPEVAEVLPAGRTKHSWR